ncbi:MAG: hypothetical protein MI723_07425 [Caulobacterales bacterium]|nr:hypothetical protein [Caulobacterales bacterium]
MVDALSNAWREDTIRGLQAIDAAAAEARTRVATGRKINSAKDNGGIYAVAIGLKSDEIGARVRIGALERVMGTLDVAVAATEAVQDLLLEMRSIAVALSDTSLDAISAGHKQIRYLSLYEQALNVVDAAEFGESNLVDGTTTSLTSIGIDTTITGYNLADALSGGAASDLGGILSAGFPGVAPPNPDGSGTPAQYLALTSEIDALIEGLGTVTAALGTTVETVNIQSTYLSELADSFKAGRGNLIDADLGAEAARFQSLQIKRELAAQFIPIASRGPETILRLFQ